MATLTGQSIASSYEQLLHVDTDGGGNTTTLVPIKDGDNGTTFCLQLSTTKAMIEGNGSTLYFYDEGGESISADNAGVLSIAAGAEIDLTATAVDLNGTLDVSGTLTLAGNADFNGDLDVDGTTNLDVVDIDGAVDMASTLAVGDDINSGGNYIVNEQGRQDHVANTMPAPYYRFDGSDDVITVADSAVYEFGTSDFAISLWIYFESTVAIQGIWEKRTDANNQIRVYTDGDSNLNLLGKTSGSTRIHAETSGGLSAGEWYHLAVVCDRDSGNTIYINGVSQTLINNTKDDGAYSMAFGATTIGRSESAAAYFGGSMTSLMLHNHALDATEVKELYSGASVPLNIKVRVRRSLGILIGFKIV